MIGRMLAYGGSNCLIRFILSESIGRDIPIVSLDRSGGSAEALSASAALKVAQYEPQDSIPQTHDSGLHYGCFPATTKKPQA